MKTLQKIEKLGYKVTFNLGSKSGVQCISSVTAKKQGCYDKIEKNITALYNRLK